MNWLNPECSSPDILHCAVRSFSRWIVSRSAQARISNNPTADAVNCSTAGDMNSLNPGRGEGRGGDENENPCGKHHSPPPPPPIGSPMDEASGSITLLPFPVRQGPPVDWAELPADLVAAICKRLHDLFDFVYFRAVCKKWHTASANSIAVLPPPQFPRILEHVDSKHLRVYSLITGKTRTIRCPKACDKILRGPSHGYLYATVFPSKRLINLLLNPLTNDEVHLELERDFHGSMVCMDPDPMGKNSYIAFKRNYHDQEMSFYQPHNREWYYVQLPVVRINLGSACLNGLYYLIDNDTGYTLVADIAGGSFFSVPPPDNLDASTVYLVESAGKILSIARWEDLCTDPSNFDFSFDIYRLDAVDKNCGYRWVKISSIGNQILFLEIDGGISIAACETTGLWGNCIYYLTSRPGELFRYNIEDGQVELCCHLGGLSSNWFVPHITGLSFGNL